MTDLDSLPFDYPSEPNLGAAPPKSCIHPRQLRRQFEGGVACGRCGKELDPERQARGRRARNRGNSIERQMAARLGLRRVGQYGGPDDLAGDLFAAQVKSGLSFPERLWKWLKQVPTKAGQTALLVVTDAPGPGRRRRALVILDLDEWAALHGRDSDEEIQPVDPYLEEVVSQ